MTTANVVGKTRPLVVIMGATGVGKTKLSVDLCLKFGGEVVSTDSIQVYQGLDIGTNKATKEEMKGIPHHMMNYLPPLSLGNTVISFRDRALKVLEKIWAKGKLPVLVGGTTYYIESILWDVLMKSPEQNGQPEDETDISFLFRNLPEHLLSSPTCELYEHLRSIDPDFSRFVHPTNRRRIMAALQIFYETGKPKSQHLADQQNTEGGNMLGGPLRFPRTCLLWLKSDSEILEKRLNKRIESMVSLGLKSEITHFYDSYYESYLQQTADAEQKLGSGPDSQTPKGLFQSIALKEFFPFLALSQEIRETENGQKLFEEGLERLRIATRQYSRRQDKWVKGRLLRKSDREVPPVYVLDSSNYPDAWETDVLQPAFNIIDAFLQGKEPDAKPCEVMKEDGNMQRRNEVFHCEPCGNVVAGFVQWQNHQKSKKHKHFQSKLRRDRLQKLCENLESRSEQLQTP